MTIRGFQRKPKARVFGVVGGYSLLDGKSAITAANEDVAFRIRILDTAQRQKTRELEIILDARLML